LSRFYSTFAGVLVLNFKTQFNTFLAFVPNFFLTFIASMIDTVQGSDAGSGGVELPQQSEVA